MLSNKVFLIGNLGNDPEIIETSNNTKLAIVSLATTEYYKNQNGEKSENTQWHRITAWGPKAELFEKYLKKGERIMVEGKIVNRSYTNKAGDKRYSTEIKVLDIQFFNQKKAA